MRCDVWCYGTCHEVSLTHSLVRALVHSRLDYCNGVLAGMFQYQIDRLQSVLRAAARLVLGLPKWASVSDAMHDELHWLPFPERVEFKLCSVVYKCLHESAPRYLSQYCIPVASLPDRSHLRSAASGDLFVPATSTKTIGPRGFFHAGPAAWNCLPSSLKDPNITFTVFKNCLKLNFSNIEHSRMRLCGSLLERRRCNTSIKWCCVKGSNAL